ncbi:MAG: aromatic acid exporter family protein [Solirubrobacteraceae bacterium]
MIDAVADRLTDPVRWANAAQMVKVALAAVLAWVISVKVLHTSQEFLAPWVALLTVQATVFGTLRNGLQQALASLIGVLLAFGAGHLFGLNALSLGLVVLVGLVVGSVRGLRADATAIAATAVIVLVAGYSDKSGMLLARLGDTGIGIGVGLLVNLLVWPPLRDRSAARQIESIVEGTGDLILGIAEDLSAGPLQEAVERWIARSEELDGKLDEAWTTLHQARESGRLNPRPAAAGRMRAAQSFGDMLEHLGQAVAETRSMARTVGLAHLQPERWPDCFRGPYLELVHRAGEEVTAGGATGLRAVRADVEALADRLDLDELPNGFWPVGGALLVNLRNILEALDVIVAARPVEVPAPELPTKLRHPVADRHGVSAH